MEERIQRLENIVLRLVVMLQNADTQEKTLSFGTAEHSHALFDHIDRQILREIVKNLGGEE